VQIGVLLGGEENSTRAQMQAVIEFETQIAQITSPLEDRRDEEELYHLMPLSEVQQIAPFVSVSIKNITDKWDMAILVHILPIV